MNKNKNFQRKLIDLVIDKLKNNWLILVVFSLFSLILTIMGFEIDKESYISLFNASATIIAALIGFIGLFVVYRLQTILDMKNHYIKKVETLADNLEIYSLQIIQYTPDKVKDEIGEISNKIDELERTIKMKSDDGLIPGKESREFRILNEINYILGLIKNHLDLEQKFNPCKDSFLFAFFGIFVFMIAIASNQINISHTNYNIIFEYWKFVKMSFTGLLIGIFVIILRDFAIMLENFFTKDSV